MASIHHEATIDVSAEAAWARLRQVDQAHTLFAPVLVDGMFDRDAQTRTVRFANGMVAQERILDVDEARRRVAYTVVGGAGMSYHHASMQIIDTGPKHCRFVWVSDFLPAEFRDQMAPLVDAGTRALKANLESAQGVRAARPPATAR
jgi:hypothetical protein